MAYQIPLIKLKHLEIVSSQNVDYTTLIKDISQKTKWRIWNIFSYRRLLRATYGRVDKLRQLDFKNISVELVFQEWIKYPNSVDEICFSAMMELQSLFSKVEQYDFSDFIAQTISITCFEKNYKDDYDSNSPLFLDFKQLILNSDLIEMFAIFNHICKSEETTQKNWEQQFSQVAVYNKHWNQAGGSALNKFNVINTIRNICNDFNLKYHKAILMPYGMIQVNSLSRATESYIRDTMSKIIESEMIAKRGA